MAESYEPQLCFDTLEAEQITSEMIDLIKGVLSKANARLEMFFASVQNEQEKKRYAQDIRDDPLGLAKLAFEVLSDKEEKDGGINLTAEEKLAIKLYIKYLNGRKVSREAVEELMEISID